MRTFSDRLMRGENECEVKLKDVKLPDALCSNGVSCTSK